MVEPQVIVARHKPYNLKPIRKYYKRQKPRFKPTVLASLINFAGYENILELAAGIATR